VCNRFEELGRVGGLLIPSGDTEVDVMRCMVETFRCILRCSFATYSQLPCYYSLYHLFSGKGRGDNQGLCYMPNVPLE